MAKKVRKSKSNRKNNQSSKLKLRPGDIIHLHRDFCTVPSGRYVYSSSFGKLINLQLGDAFVGIDRKCLSFCSIEKGQLSPEEIFVTQTRMMELIEKISHGSSRTIDGGGSFSVSTLTPEMVKDLELDS